MMNGRKSPGFWQALDSLPTGAAVAADWRRAMGSDFEIGQTFLKPTTEQSEWHPCTNTRSCGFPHRVMVHSPTRMVAVREETECPPFKVEPRDVLVYAVDRLKFCGAIARALKFDSAPGVNGTGNNHSPKVWPVGIYPCIHSPVYFSLCLTEDEMLADIEGLVNMENKPFILLAASQRNKSASVQSLLQRQRCEFISLSCCLELSGKGQFKETNSIQPILDRFTARLAEVATIAPVLESIKREIKLVRDERQGLLKAKAQLEAMHGEGLFGFVQKIDREARDLFFAILAAGDTAKASRALEMKDSTLRSKVAKWRKRGKPYLALAEFVRWRKSIKGQAGAEFAKRLASGAERETDYPALIRDIIEDLEDFNSDNWDEKCESLANMLRKVAS